jgi:putative effector of murein hydrolase
MKVVLWTAVTVAAYSVGLTARRFARRHPLANPVLIAMALTIAILRLTQTPYADYLAASWPIVFLLGPATVALGVPLAANFGPLRRSMGAVLIALSAGAAAALLTGFILVRVFGGSEVTGLSMLPKSATTPIAMGIAAQIGGQPALSAAFAILGGIIAAISIRGLLRLLRVDHPQALGLAAGTAGSGIAAAYVAAFGDAPAAFAAIGIGLNGLVTSVLAPLAARFLR